LAGVQGQSPSGAPDTPDTIDHKAGSPALSEKRLFVTPHGDISYSLKTPYRDGTTPVIFEPLDFIARLAALVPPSRLSLSRFHGVFAPISPHRARITPARRGRGREAQNAGAGRKPHASRAWSGTARAVTAQRRQQGA